MKRHPILWFIGVWCDLTGATALADVCQRVIARSGGAS